jgi:hypothetical protein
MTIRTRILTVGAAAMLALTIVSMSVGHAVAKPRRPVDNGIRCAIFNEQTGEWEFYLPGDVITADIAGFSQRFRCGADGNWVVVAQVAPAGGGTLVTRPVESAP